MNLLKVVENKWSPLLANNSNYNNTFTKNTKSANNNFKQNKTPNLQHLVTVNYNLSLAPLKKTKKFSKIIYK